MPRLLHVIRPLIGMIPEVQRPDRKVPFPEKAQWTILALLLYCVCSNVPLYGIQRASSLSGDPFYWMRVILASNRGTLMELGVSPLVTSGLALQLLAASRMIEVNFDSKDDKALFAGTQKVVGITVTLLQATAYVLSGMYGDVSAIGAGNAALIVGQLFGAGLVVLTLDELLQKGYGLGSGISLFIAAHICEDVAWSALSPITVTTGQGTEFQGAFLAFFHLLITRSNKLQALRAALYRQNLPNLTSLMATVLVYLLCIYFQGWKVTIPVKYQRYRGQEGKYPIKLFYTGNMPVVLLTAMISNVYFVSQLLYARAPNNVLVRLVGVWATDEIEGSNMANSIPVDGLAYYVSPPPSMAEILYDPFRALFYLLFTLTSCAVFSRAWTEVSGTTSRHVARQMRDNQIVMKGHRDAATATVLNRYVPIAAALGGVAVGTLTVLADFLGAVGSGTGILLSVTIIFEFYESYMKETMGGMNLAALGLAQQ